MTLTLKYSQNRKKTPIGAIFSNDQWEDVQNTFKRLKRKLGARIAKVANLSIEINTLLDENHHLKINNAALIEENRELKKSSLYKENECLQAENWSLHCERGDTEEKYKQQLREQKEEFNRQLDEAYKYADMKESKYTSAVSSLNEKLKKKDKVIELLCKDNDITSTELKKYEEKAVKKTKKKEHEMSR